MIKYFGNSLGYFGKAMELYRLRDSDDAGVILFFLSIRDMGWRALKGYMDSQDLPKLLSAESLIKMLQSLG